VNTLPVGEHVRCFLRAAFALEAEPGLAERRYGRCAHALGYRGHCLTKSRRYSTTFKALRQAREEHVREQLLRHTTDRVQRALAELDASDRITSFRYAGQGHLTTADALLAASAATRAREGRRAAREELQSCRTSRGSDGLGTQ
jgi:replication initiator protein RepSA